MKMNVVDVQQKVILVRVVVVLTEKYHISIVTDAVMIAKNFMIWKMKKFVKIV